MVDWVENVVEGDIGIRAPCKLRKMTRHPHPTSVPDLEVRGPLDLVVMVYLVGWSHQTDLRKSCPQPCPSGCIQSSLLSIATELEERC